MATLALENLVKTYPGNVRAVDGLSLDVADGELIVLVGPSGCGKTTTLRLIAGLERPNGGRILIDGRSADGVSPRDRDVAMVFQGHILYPHLTVAGNLAFGLRLRRVAKPEIRRRVAEAAETLGITDLLDRRPGELSGGQQQRVALGRAVVRGPKLFLFDEPLSNLDVALRSQMRAEIRRLHARLGVTTVHVTHDQTEAMTLGQRIAVLRAGRVQQVADPPTIYGRPANRFVAAQFGGPAMNFFEGRIEQCDGRPVFQAGPATGGDGHGALTLPIPDAWTARLAPYTGRPVTLGIRPEHLGLTVAQQRADAPWIAARVEAVEPLGPESHIYCTCGAAAFVSRMAADHRVATGDHVRLAVAVAHLHFFDPRTEQSVA